MRRPPRPWPRVTRATSWRPHARSSMPASPRLALVDVPKRIWRVERVDRPLRFSKINAVDAARLRSGNRFDVPGAGVLYAATRPEGAFAETLAPFRPAASLLAKLAAADVDPLLLAPGTV